MPNCARELDSRGNDEVISVRRRAPWSSLAARPPEEGLLVGISSGAALAGVAAVAARPEFADRRS